MMFFNIKDLILNFERLLIISFIAISILFISCANHSSSSETSTDNGTNETINDNGDVSNEDNIVSAVFVEVEGDFVVWDSSTGRIRPGRQFRINKFFMSDHEVTQYEFQSIMGNNPSQCKGVPASSEKQEKRAVENVTWYAAIAYCNKRSFIEGLEQCYIISGVDFSGNVNIPTESNSTWDNVQCDFTKNGYRLPSEAEWLYAAMGGSSGVVYNDNNTVVYAGTNNSRELEIYAWYGDAYILGGHEYGTHEVKKKRANILGLYDMSGNVNELCWYDINSSNISSTGLRNGYCITHGGSWGESEHDCNVINRVIGFAYISNRYTGFRVVRSAL